MKPLLWHVPKYKTELRIFGMKKRHVLVEEEKFFLYLSTVAQSTRGGVEGSIIMSEIDSGVASSMGE